MRKSSDILREIVDKLSDGKIAIPQGTINELTNAEAISAEANRLVESTELRRRRS